MKNIILFISLIALLAILWGLYQVMGDYLHLIFLIAAIALLIKNSKGPKFKKKSDE